MNPNKPEDVYLDILRNLDGSGYRQGIKILGNASSDNKSERSSPSRS